MDFLLGTRFINRRIVRRSPGRAVREYFTQGYEQVSTLVKLDDANKMTKKKCLNAEIPFIFEKIVHKSAIYEKYSKKRLISHVLHHEMFTNNLNTRSTVEHLRAFA
jgi:hypothetical protein